MSIFEDVGKLLGSVAPWIVKALPLPPPLGNMAAGVLAKALGSDKTDSDSISQAIAGATPEQLSALKAADQQFMLQMQELGFKHVEDLERIAADDRANARAREITLKDKIPALLAIGVTLGFFGVLVFVMKWEVPTSGRDVMNIMLGSLGTAWVSIISYYFGSSSGSKDKDSIIASMSAGQ